MGLSNELVVILAAVGSVIFLFVMDHYYRGQEARADQELLEFGDPVDDNFPDEETYRETGVENDDSDMAA